MESSGYNIGIIFAFLGGLGVSFTGCTYPLLPILLSSMSGYIQGRRLRGFLLGFIYVSGFALVYSLMGIVAGFTGSIFGIILTYPIIRIVAGFLFILFGLSFLEIFYLKIISFRPPLISVNNPYLKLFLIGLSSGLVISPCVSPVLGSILLYIALNKNIIYGWILTLSFAYGLGFLLILVATFSGILLSLPKSGRWMHYLKKIGGIILIFIGGYFIISTFLTRF